MTDEEKKERSKALEEMASMPGWKVVMDYVDEEIREGWESFISLPVDKKTNKAAYNAQARYKVLKNFKEWIDSEIKIGK